MLGIFYPSLLVLLEVKKMGIWRIVNKKLGGFRNDFPGRKGKSLYGITGLDEKMKDSNRNKRQLCGLLSMVRSAQARLYFLCLPPSCPSVSLPQHPPPSQSLFLPLHGRAGFPAGAAVPLQKRTAVNNAGRVIKALSEPLTSRDAGW